MTTVLIAALAYIVCTFPLAYLWHLTVFKGRYAALKVYRDDPIPLFGLASMVIQGLIFGLVYATAIVPLDAGWIQKAAIYAALGGSLSWSFTTVAAAAKSPMTSRRDYVMLETAFTAIQWVLVAVLTVLAAG